MMKRTLYLAALCMAATLVFAPAALAQQDVDCDDFGSSFGAQQYFDFVSPPGDPNGLDADGDGLACEDGGGATQPAAPTTTQYTQPNAETPIIENPRNCDEFGGSQAAAQQFLENVTPEDEFNLDADDDGIACEGLLSGGAEAPATTATQYETPAVTTTTTATTALPTTGGLPLVPLAGASLLVLGVAGLAVRRRVS